jgi:hypothetical protein
VGSICVRAGWALALRRTSAARADCRPELIRIGALTVMVQRARRHFGLGEANN